MPAYQTVIERQDLLLTMLPEGDPSHCGILVKDLLAKIEGRHAGQLYSSDPTGKRKLQRDLQDLVERGRVSSAAAANNGKRFARVPLEEDMEIDELAFAHLVEGLDVYCSNVTRAHRLAAALRRLQSSEDGGLVLTPDRFRSIAGGELLLPAEFKPAVLAALLRGLATGQVVRAVYVNQGQRTELTLHVQAAVHRGHDLVILAVDGAKAAKGVQAFLLHHFVSAAVIKAPAIRRADFDLEQSIEQGLGLSDQVAGKPIKVELLARGEVADLLRDCPLEVHQRYDDDEEEGDGYEARVIATVTSSAKLWRWLAGWGADIKVMGPPAVVKLLAQRAAAAAALYEEADDPDDQPGVEPIHPCFISPRTSTERLTLIGDRWHPSLYCLADLRSSVGEQSARS